MGPPNGGPITLERLWPGAFATPSGRSLEGLIRRSPAMQAITVDGERIECDDIEEGAHGVFCYHDERVVGYVPYDRLDRVTETRTPVASSSIRSVGYDEDENVLEIAFQSGGIYRYADVPHDTYEELLRARSHGSYFHENIRGEYDYHRIR